MNNAMQTTIDMVVAGAKALGGGSLHGGRSTHVTHNLHWSTVFVDDVFEGRHTSMGGVTVYENGRWEAFSRNDSSARMFIESSELAALRFRRAA